MVTLWCCIGVRVHVRASGSQSYSDSEFKSVLHRIIPMNGIYMGHNEAKWNVFDWVLTHAYPDIHTLIYAIRYKYTALIRHAKMCLYSGGKII